MRYVLGFDGGGTKTECVLMDEARHILARSRSGPSNPYRVGSKAAFTAIQEGAQRAIAEARIDRDSVAALCAGLAGASHEELSGQMRALLSNAFPSAAVNVCTDLDLVLAAAGDGPAVVLVAGTGSSAMARNSEGQYFRAGGYGPQIGDDGSAYDVGRRAVLACLRERDRTGDDCPLGHRILAQLGNRTWPEIQQSIRAAPDQVFPRVFPIVASAAENHDELARILLHDAAREFAALVRVVAIRAGLQGTPFLIAKTGGMLGRSAFFDAQLDRELREAEPKARLGVFSDLAQAAARLALRYLGQAGAVGH
jgi:N-acetylglucosamine kinase-like BadF-type ATPase